MNVNDFKSVCSSVYFILFEHEDSRIINSNNFVVDTEYSTCKYSLGMGIVYYVYILYCIDD